MANSQPSIEAQLAAIFAAVSDDLDREWVGDTNSREHIEFVCRCVANRAGARLLLACSLAKIDNPNVDPREPYTEIGGATCFSGRTYDERYLTPFINRHRLPVNATTAFLTPTLRNHNKRLTTTTNLVGRPRDLYRRALQLLDDVAENRITAWDLFAETTRQLVLLRNAQQLRIDSLLSELANAETDWPLSSEAVVALISQHLACKNSSRLPVLIVAAAYEAAGAQLAEQIRPLYSHHAADLQTGAIGDVEVCLLSADETVTAYEMKMKTVSVDDVEAAITKIYRSNVRIDNYIFITTGSINPEVTKYAASLYDRLGGTEIAVLDCIGFLRHFLHLFHRLRMAYLNAYQQLVLAEPDSAVSQVLKEAFLTLRRAAESGE